MIKKIVIFSVLLISSIQVTAMQQHIAQMKTRLNELTNIVDEENFAVANQGFISELENIGNQLITYRTNNSNNKQLFFKLTGLITQASLTKSKFLLNQQ